MKNKVVFIRSTPINPDVRIEKEASSLSETGKYECFVLGWDRKKEFSKKENAKFGKIIRFYVPGKYNSFLLFFSLPIWWIYVFTWLLKNNFDIVHGCNLDTFLPAYLVAKIKKKKIVYDIFDFYAYMLAKKIPGFVKNILIFLERGAIARADSVIIADNSRLPQLGNIKPKKIIELLNTPPKSILNNINEDILNKYLGSDHLEYEKKVIFSGLLGETRGLLKILKIAKELEDVLFVFSGLGPLENLLKKQTARNILFLGSIPYEDNLSLCKKCSAMITLYDPKIPNNLVASPNKLFESLMVQTPVLINEEIQIKELVEKNNLGGICSYTDENDIKQALLNILNNKIGYNKEKAKNLFKNEYNWEIMGQRLTYLYNELAS